MIRACFALAAVALVGCSSSSSSSAPEADDSGADAGYDSAPPPYTPIGVGDGGETPFDSGPLPAGDGGLQAKCAILESTVTTAATAAATCDPQQTPSQRCSAETPGLCCAVTISFSTNISLIDDLNAAIAAFNTAGCAIDCSKVACSPAPSNVCIGSGSSGLCQ